MGLTPTSSEIDAKDNEIFGRVLSYANSIEAARDALNQYDQLGHGRFAWLAYKNVRDAERLWPAYREAIVAHVSTLENGQEFYLSHLSTEALDTLRERVLCILDGVVDDLLELGDTSSKQGHAAIKRALRIDGEKSPTSSNARALEERVINEMTGKYLHLLFLQERFGLGDPRFTQLPPATAQHIKRMVANETGASLSQVDAIWRHHLSDGEGADHYKALIQQVKEQNKALKRKLVEKVKTAPKKRAKPSANHRWRKSVRTKI